MNAESVMTLGREGMQIMIMIAAPMLLAALVVGLIVSIFQAATQINEQTLTFIPKLVTVLVVLVIAGPWILSVLTDYMHHVLTQFPTFSE